MGRGKGYKKVKNTRRRKMAKKKKGLELGEKEKGVKKRTA